MGYNKNFSEWCEKKECINSLKNYPLYFKEGDIWWVSVGVNINSEIDGKSNNFSRPVLVLKRINRYMCIGLPMTTNIKPFYLKKIITFKERDVGVIGSQVRAFSTSRFISKMGRVSPQSMNKIKEDFCYEIFPSSRKDKVD